MFNFIIANIFYKAICAWLLALLKYNIQRECIKERFSSLHRAFMDFLSDDSGK